MIHSLKSNRGVSLVEVVVALAVAVIILSAVFNLLSAGNNIASKSNTRFSEHASATSIMNKIKDSVQYADSITICQDASLLPDDHSGIYFGTDPYQSIPQASALPAGAGLVLKNGANTTVYLKDTFSGYHCSLNFSKKDDTTLTVAVKLSADSRKDDNYTLSEDIPINNIPAASGIQDNAGGNGTAVIYTVFDPNSGK